MQDNRTPDALRTDSPTSRMVPRREISTEPFTDRECNEIIVQHFYLGYGVAKLAKVRGTGFEVIENVLRKGFFRAVGKRRSDMADRAKVAA